MINVTVTGTNTVISNLKGLDTTLQRKVQQESITSAKKVEAAAKRALDPKKVSGGAGIVGSSGIVVRSNEVIVEFHKSYAYYIEFGRSPNRKPPPIQPILDWVKKRGLVGSYSIKSRNRVGNATNRANEEKWAAIFISRKIGKRGIKPFPFLHPAFEQEKPYFIQRMRNL